MWARHDVQTRARGAKRYCSPLAGEIELRFERFSVNAEEGQTLLVYYAEPGRRHEQTLVLLATLADRPRRPAPAARPQVR